MRKLTEQQAFVTMRLFLERIWQRNNQIEVGQLLSDTDTTIWADGGTADPAARAEWLECVELAIEGKREAAE